jgi:hypothetical protein
MILDPDSDTKPYTGHCKNAKKLGLLPSSQLSTTKIYQLTESRDANSYPYLNRSKSFVEKVKFALKFIRNENFRFKEKTHIKFACMSDLAPSYTGTNTKKGKLQLLTSIKTKSKTFFRPHSSCGF